MLSLTAMTWSQLQDNKDAGISRSSPGWETGHLIDFNRLLGPHIAFGRCDSMFSLTAGAAAAVNEQIEKVVWVRGFEPDAKEEESTGRT